MEDEQRRREGSPFRSTPMIAPRRARAALLLFLAAAPMLSHAAVDWRRTALAPAIRDKVHFTIKEVPRFPHDDPKLMNPGSWPSITYVKSAPCFLKIETGAGDARWRVTSLNQV